MVPGWAAVMMFYDGELHIVHVDLGRLSFDLGKLFVGKEKNSVFISHDQQTWSAGDRMERLYRLQKRLVARGAKVYIVDNRANLTSSGVPEAVKNTDLMVPMLTAAYYEAQGVTVLEMAHEQRQTWVFPVPVQRVVVEQFRGWKVGYNFKTQEEVAMAPHALYTTWCATGTRKTKNSFHSRLFAKGRNVTHFWSHCHL